ncbi:MAG: pallilysin-related adhesin [Treponema sp.]|nr:pallilysin-related adhesin [Treponema sp.]
MKQHIVPIIFVLIAGALVVAFVVYKNKTEVAPRYVQPQVVTPSVDNSHDESKNDAYLSDDTSLTSFIPLASDETLLGILSVDFDGDTREDQINLIRKITNPYVTLLIGLYNPETGAYERTSEIATQISQVKSFSYNCLDVVGNHRLALVYQGITNSGESVMQIYTGERSRKHFSLVNIGNFKSNGTIFIQQSQRPESYELSQSMGASFPVWVYSSPMDEAGHPTGDQLQTKYEWSSKAKKYVQTDEIRISGSKKLTKNLARLDGTEKSYGTFLNGLWYKTTNTGKGIRYMSFDYDNSEIIQLYADTEEVYNWGNSFINGTSMTISAENASMGNLHRRFYISLLDMDEITIRLQEDLGMTIDESNLWNGSYKRMKETSTFVTDTEKYSINDYIGTLTKESNWTTADGSSVDFSGFSYTVSGDTATDNGKFVGIDIGTHAIITFRSTAVRPYFSPNYELAYEKIEKINQKTKKVETVDNKDRIIMTPVVITPQGCQPSEDHQITLSRVISSK